MPNLNLVYGKLSLKHTKGMSCQDILSLSIYTIWPNISLSILMACQVILVGALEHQVSCEGTCGVVVNQQHNVALSSK